ncbi:protein V57 [Spheniscid alphaherpesvirus 1]|uniref:Protein V57 n=1 Tax=Spheniscid alphaherpesvirus 1 TaxID=2560777 RepID=A0A1R3T8B9_9ALPH|nr:protein V57 [Spheniscid alphaherpesvirus 1]
MFGVASLATSNDFKVFLAANPHACAKLRAAMNKTGEGSSIDCMRECDSDRRYTTSGHGKALKRGAKSNKSSDIDENGYAAGSASSAYVSRGDVDVGAGTSKRHTTTIQRRRRKSTGSTSLECNSSDRLNEVPSYRGRRSSLVTPGSKQLQNSREGRSCLRDRKSALKRQ